MRPTQRAMNSSRPTAWLRTVSSVARDCARGPCDHRAEVGPRDQVVHVDPGQGWIQVHAGEQAVDVDAVQQSVHVGPVQQCVHVHAIKQRVHIERGDNKIDDSVRHELRKCFGRGGQQPVPD